MGTEIGFLLICTALLLAVGALIWFFVSGNTAKRQPNLAEILRSETDRIHQFSEEQARGLRLE
jgi:hypothetical protein